MEEERVYKSVDESRTEQIHILFPRYLNGDGLLYGGELLFWIDEIAGVVARRHSGMSVVTAAIDHMNFKASARLGDTVFIRGHMTYVGTSSMEVRIDSYVEELQTGVRHLINTAFFVMVGLGKDGKPAQVPGLKVETISEQAEWEAAKKRQEYRKHRSQEGF